MTVETYWKFSELTSDINLELRNLSFELMLLDNVNMQEEELDYRCGEYEPWR